MNGQVEHGMHRLMLPQNQNRARFITKHPQTSSLQVKKEYQTFAVAARAIVLVLMQVLVML